MTDRLITPLVGLFVLVALQTANNLVFGLHGEYASEESDYVYAFGFSLMLAWWVYVDRRQRRYAAPFEFEAFVFFAWLVVVPIYLIQTRRWKALPLIATLAAAYWLPTIVNELIYEVSPP